MKRSWFSIKASATGADLWIYSDIGQDWDGNGVSAKDLAQQLAALNGQPVTLRLHSNGGSVFEGLAIYSALKRHTGGLTVEIDGLAASMASIIACAGDTVRIAANGYVMVHAPSDVVWGPADEMQKTAETLTKLQGTMAGIYQTRTGKSESEVQGWMAKETWFNASEALAAGLVDEITEARQIAASLNLSNFRHAPPRAKLLARPSMTRAAFDALSHPARNEYMRSGGRLVDEPKQLTGLARAIAAHTANSKK